jgi:DNA topoisomerase-3
MEHDMKVMFENAENLEERVRKEKITGTFEGEEISFSKKWGEHEFIDEEADALLNGETITFDGITGRLARQKYKGHTFWGFKKDLSWCGHVFTEEEVEALNNGEEVHGRFYSEKKKDYFECSVKLEKGKIKPIFESDGKLSWCGYTFSEKEVERLKAGEQVSGRFYSSKKNKHFECKVELVKGKIKPIFD